MSEAPADPWRRARGLSPPMAGGRRVLVLGWSPLPFEDALMNYAPGGRSWQMAAPLAADGHAVCLVAARMPGAYGDRTTPPVVECERDGVVIYLVDPCLLEEPSPLQGLMGILQPEVVVGASAVPSRWACRVAGELPVWVDLFGDPMSEAQARAAAVGNDQGLAAYRDLVAELLDRGDAFSAVSRRQAWAVVGQLGLAGRLGAASCGREMVFVLPCAAIPGASGAEPARPLEPGCADSDFVLLWSGGFNTWCDVETLFAGVSEVMARRPEVRFVSTGGAIAGHDDRTYRRLQTLIEASEHRRRFLTRGCLPHSEARWYQHRADLLLVTERLQYERQLGSSGRVVQWLADGLPLLCARASELGSTIEREGLGLTYDPADPMQLRSRILEAVRDPGRVREMARRGQRFAAERWSLEMTSRPLRAWVADARSGVGCAGANPLSLLGDATVVRRLERELADEVRRYHEVRSELGRVHQSRMWRTWMRYLGIRGTLLNVLGWFRGGRALEEGERGERAD